MEGKGLYVKNNGTKMKGIFHNDQANGKLKVKYQDGASFKGNYSKGLKNGFGVFKF